MTSRKTLFSPSSHDGKIAAAQDLCIKLQKCWGLDITWSNIDEKLKEVSASNNCNNLVLLTILIL